jgi:hypothetical protein
MAANQINVALDQPYRHSGLMNSESPFFGYSVTSSGCHGKPGFLLPTAALDTGGRFSENVAFFVHCQ